MSTFGIGSGVSHRHYSFHSSLLQCHPGFGDTDRGGFYPPVPVSVRVSLAGESLRLLCRDAPPRTSTVSGPAFGSSHLFHGPSRSFLYPSVPTGYVLHALGPTRTEPEEHPRVRDGTSATTDSSLDIRGPDTDPKPRRPRVVRGTVTSTTSAGVGV